MRFLKLTDDRGPILVNLKCIDFVHCSHDNNKLYETEVSDRGDDYVIFITLSNAETRGLRFRSWGEGQKKYLELLEILLKLRE